jgi:hypothetical protein
MGRDGTVPVSASVTLAPPLPVIGCGAFSATFSSAACLSSHCSISVRVTSGLRRQVHTTTM